MLQKLGITKGQATAGLIALLVMALVIMVFSTVGMLNKEADARYAFNAQQKIVKDYADKAWKIVQQKGQVNAKYADDFKAAYARQMDARYGGDQQQLMKWVVEHSPQLDSATYKELMTTIEAQREDYQSQATRLHDLALQHNRPFGHLYSGAVLRVCGRAEVVEVTLTSTRTENTFNSGGVEDSVSVYAQ